ncbi:hypothetical protein D3C75_1319800 [compost metagenome]
MRCTDVDCIHLRVVNQLLVSGIGYGNPVVFGEFVGTFLSARSDSIGDAITGMG